MKKRRPDGRSSLIRGAIAWLDESDNDPDTPIAVSRIRPTWAKPNNAFNHGGVNQRVIPLFIQAIFSDSPQLTTLTEPGMSRADASCDRYLESHRSRLPTTVVAGKTTTREGKTKMQIAARIFS